MAKKKPYYGVAKGRTVGVFTSWEDCELSVKGFSGAVYRGFNSNAEATSYVAGFALMEKEQKDGELARRAARAQEEQQNRSSAPRQSSTAGSNSVPQRNYARLGSFPESDEDDFIIDGTSPSRAYSIDDEPEYSNSMKRPSPYSSSYNKKPKVRDFEVVDLTDSPPKRNQNYYTHSRDTYSPQSEESLPPMKSQVEHDRRDKSERFTLDDCSDEQKYILDLVSQGKNVFFTGSAGVGKSFVLRKVAQLFKSQGLKQFADFFITASTGIAAVHVGGMTVHSFAGTGKGEDGIIELKKKVSYSKRSSKQWTGCKTLVIDEVSMLSDDLFDKLDEIGQHIRKNSRPFGGIQLVLCGDFYQLPPSGKRRCPNCGSFDSEFAGDTLKCKGKITDNYESIPCNKIFPRKIGYIFQSQAWKNSNFHIVELTKIFRQSDSEFVTALNKTRIGRPDNHTLQLFSECRRPLTHDISIKPTKMYPIRSLVQEENTREFEALKAPIQTYTAIDSQYPNDGNRSNLMVLDDLQASRRLQLRAGAQVMLLANLNVNEGLVNGSRGVVIEFVTMKEAIKYLQYQARLRGAVNEETSMAINELRAFTQGNKDVVFPRVLFETKDRTKEVIITPYTWTVQLGAFVEVSRVQIPLMTAWALTIHKCQGMTLEKCVLDLSRCFGYGMAYVALSRCKSLEGLQLVGWKGGREICADPVVDEFYKSIQVKR